jgi:hypothetical protein
MKRFFLSLLYFLTCISLNGLAQTGAVSPDLSDKANFQSVNRDITREEDKSGKTIIHLNAKPDAGIALISDLDFGTGVIEFDVKGKDVLQESFIGIAFHCLNDTTYECVYFRPFNFQSNDPVRKKHAVQYVSLPQFDWSYLRNEYPDKYEHAMLQPVDPNDWFHVKIIVEENRIQVFVNSEARPCLSVEPLTTRLSGKTGFWVGNGSDGDFANLTLVSR